VPVHRTMSVSRTRVTSRRQRVISLPSEYQRTTGLGMKRAEAVVAESHRYFRSRTLSDGGSRRRFVSVAGASCLPGYARRFRL